MAPRVVRVTTRREETKDKQADNEDRQGIGSWVILHEPQQNDQNARYDQEQTANRRNGNPIKGKEPCKNEEYP